jgi:dephospho-CoA kinase
MKTNEKPHLPGKNGGTKHKMPDNIQKFFINRCTRVERLDDLESVSAHEKFGIKNDAAPQFPSSCENVEQIMSKARAMGSPLLIAITGGIACGKTTVSAMLEKLGFPLIDFDLISRQVVEPGTPALANIVNYFGKKVLMADGRLDRKTLSEIVFADRQKRKKLESFTHPPIFEEFFRQVEKITRKDPKAIIQVAVPLLIELKLCSLFDCVVVVYISAAEQ